MVRVLVAHGASIDLQGGSDSWTPLMYAAMAGMYVRMSACMYVRIIMYTAMAVMLTCMYNYDL